MGEPRECGRFDPITTIVERFGWYDGDRRDTDPEPLHQMFIEPATAADDDSIGCGRPTPDGLGDGCRGQFGERCLYIRRVAAR